jgi:hypothetical protein
MSEGRRSKRLSKQNPIDYSDTKRISSPNRYSVLDQEEVEESIVFYPDTEEENVNNDDDGDDDWIITGTMANEPKTKEIDLGLTKEELSQNDTASLLDILRFIRLLANKAAMVGTERTGLGLYADLVETTEAYKDRVGNEFTTMPTAPTKPSFPTQQQAGQTALDYKIAQDLYKKKNKIYAEYLAVTRALKKAIQVKFPLLCDGFQGSEFGRLPADKTPGEILQIMADRSVTNKSDRERLAMELEIQMLESTYTPDLNGPIRYLKALRENRALANEVTKEHRVNEERFMNYAIRAFEDCGHDRTQIGRLKTEWEKQRLQSPKVGKELIEEFETFWCRELRNLYRLEGKDHQANLTFDVESVHNRFDEIEQDQSHEFQALRAELQALKAQMDATIDATTAKHDVPSVVTAPTVSTNSNPNDSLMAMMAGLVAALQQNQNQAAPAPKAGNPTNPRNPRNRNRANEWRLVDKWCWNCSANTTHNSSDCRSRGTKAPAHKEATMDKPDGGNTSNNEHWGMWHHPKKGYRASKPGK